MVDVFRPLFRTVEDRVANRREQLRKAQKTFRERRDQYLKNLEQQVQRLQKSESELQTHVDRLERELAEATNRLAVIDSKRNGFAQYPHQNQNQNSFRADRNNNNWETNNWESNDFISPQSQSHLQFQFQPHGGVSNDKVNTSQSQSQSPSGSGSAVVWVESQNDKPWQMHVLSSTKTDLSSNRQPQWPLSPVSLESENTNNTSSPQDWYSRSHFTDQQIQHNISQLSRESIFSVNSGYVAQLDLVIVAMEFVLKLERPCLPHIHQPDDDGNQTAPQGHVHTATAALLCSNNNSAVAPTQDICSRSWNAPTEVLRRLLEASSTLPVEQGLEVTPIQVWHMISQSRGFASMKVEKLTVLSDRLLTQIKCYGFGAVLKHDHIKKIIADI